MPKIDRAAGGGRGGGRHMFMELLNQATNRFWYWITITSNDSSAILAPALYTDGVMIEGKNPTSMSDDDLRLTATPPPMPFQNW